MSELDASTSENDCEDVSNGQVCEDEISQFIDSLSDEAIEAGVRAIEDEVIGDQMIVFPRNVKTVIDCVLRASHKVE